MRNVVEMPETSNSNIHGHIHGEAIDNYCNTGGVEENIMVAGFKKCFY
jgi:hypothetical protein